MLPWFFFCGFGSDAQALATILTVYAQRHGGPSQLAADRLVALLTASTDSAPGTLPIFYFRLGRFSWSFGQALTCQSWFLRCQLRPLRQHARTPFWETCRFFFLFRSTSQLCHVIGLIVDFSICWSPFR